MGKSSAKPAVSDFSQAVGRIRELEREDAQLREETGDRSAKKARALRSSERSTALLLGPRRAEHAEAGEARRWAS